MEEEPHALSVLAERRVPLLQRGGEPRRSSPSGSSPPPRRPGSRPSSSSSTTAAPTAPRPSSTNLATRVRRRGAVGAAHDRNRGIAASWRSGVDAGAWRVRVPDRRRPAEPAGRGRDALPAAAGERGRPRAGNTLEHRSAPRLAAALVARVERDAQPAVRHAGEGQQVGFRARPEAGDRRRHRARQAGTGTSRRSSPCRRAREGLLDPRGRDALREPVRRRVVPRPRDRCGSASRRSRTSSRRSPSSDSAPRRRRNKAVDADARAAGHGRAIRTAAGGGLVRGVLRDDAAPQVDDPAFGTRDLPRSQGDRVALEGRARGAATPEAAAAAPARVRARSLLSRRDARRGRAPARDELARRHPPPAAAVEGRRAAQPLLQASSPTTTASARC